VSNSDKVVAAALMGAMSVGSADFVDQRGEGASDHEEEYSEFA
jgi:hypothetical protein